MRMEVHFPGGLAVEAETGAHRVRTDQPVKAGGAGSSPAPFELFLASIATCAGFYALRFCQERGIATDELRVTLETERDEERKRIGRIRIHVTPPSGLPAKYHRALLRSIDLCAVKRHILEPPEFAVELLAPEAAAIPAGES